MTTYDPSPDAFEDPASEEKSEWAKTPRSPEAQGSMIPGGWKPTTEKPVPVVRCTQIKKDGNRCGRWSIRGTTKCLVHGGRLPSVREHAAATVEAARLRLIDLSDPAIDVLDDLIQPGTADQIRLKAATEILDRAGVRGGFEVDMEVNVGGMSPAETVATRLEEISKRLRGDVAEEIEVEIVTDDDSTDE